MLPISTFYNVPSFFLYGFKHGGARHPYESFLNLRHLVFVHSFNNTYEKDLKILNFKIYSESDNGISYFVSIGSKNEIINPKHEPIKVFCSCPDFRYTFAYVLNNRGALLYKERFPKIFFEIPPKHRNPYQIPWGCKHIFTITNLLRYKYDKIHFSEKFVLKYTRKNNPYFIPKLIITDYELKSWLYDKKIANPEFLKNNIEGVINYGKRKEKNQRNYGRTKTGNTTTKTRK